VALAGADVTPWTSDQLRDYRARQDAYLALADRLRRPRPWYQQPRWWLLIAAAALAWVDASLIIIDAACVYAEKGLQDK
jgi:hypothetical protein